MSSRIAVCCPIVAVREAFAEALLRLAIDPRQPVADDLPILHLLLVRRAHPFVDEVRHAHRARRRAEFIGRDDHVRERGDDPLFRLGEQARPRDFLFEQVRIEADARRVEFRGEAAQIQRGGERRGREDAARSLAAGKSERERGRIHDDDSVGSGRAVRGAAPHLAPRTGEGGKLFSNKFAPTARSPSWPVDHGDDGRAGALPAWVTEDSVARQTPLTDRKGGSGAGRGDRRCR